MKYFESLRRLITENQRQLELFLVHIFTGTQGTNNTMAVNCFISHLIENFLILSFIQNLTAKFPQSPVVHYAYSSWIKNTMAKQSIVFETTVLFENSLGCYGNLPNLTIKRCFLKIERIRAARDFIIWRFAFRICRRTWVRNVNYRCNYYIDWLYINHEIVDSFKA